MQASAERRAENGIGTCGLVASLMAMYQNGGGTPKKMAFPLNRCPENTPKSLAKIGCIRQAQHGLRFC